MRYLITGAASGIGRAVATLAAQQSSSDSSVSLALLDRDEPLLNSVAEELSGAGVNCLPLVVDLADPEAPGTAVRSAVDTFGGLDTVVSNAGVLLGGALEDIDLANYEKTFAINTRVTWLLGKAALPALRQSRGSIVATASISATFPTPPAGLYSPSKAALVMLIKQMALEWGMYGVRANCVSPGPTDTALTRNSFGVGVSDASQDNRAYREALIPLRKIGRPDEVAETVLFLAGPKASQITGVDLAVDGGVSLSVMPLAGGAPGYRLDQLNSKFAEIRR
jgi:NAD(P)-dependent dehydrogenase (short-subunit alcohol dehydrogenase family)